MRKVNDNGYPRLSVGKLIEMLQKFDPALPIAYEGRDYEGERDIELETYWEDTNYPTRAIDINLEPCNLISRSGASIRFEDVVIVSVLP